MIPIRLWNSFTQETRVDIASIIYGCDILNTAMFRDLAYEFHHNFDHKDGSLVKGTLYHLNLQKDGSINIVINVKPKYKKDVSKPKPAPRESAPKHFLLRYLDKGGDLTNVHLYAENATQAKEEAKNEYWDIESIIEVTEIA